MIKISIVVTISCLLLASGCKREEKVPAKVGIPFTGPVKNAQPVQSEVEQKPPVISEPVAVETAGKPLEAPLEVATSPVEPQLDDKAKQIKNIWLSEKFRCRAISTARLRDCKFEKTDTGYKLDLHKGVVCKNVEFGQDGHPAKLLGCGCDWINIPADNDLKKLKTENSWSGSHREWYWPEDETKYCCPGMWLMAPKALEELLELDEGEQDAGGNR